MISADSSVDSPHNKFRMLVSDVDKMTTLYFVVNWSQHNSPLQVNYEIMYKSGSELLLNFWWRTLALKLIHFVPRQFRLSGTQHVMKILPPQLVQLVVLLHLNLILELLQLPGSLQH